MQESLRTDRLLLRPARESDLADLHAIFSHPQAMRYWDRPAYTELGETQKFLTGFMAGGSECYEFILDYRGQCIGKAGVWKRPEIGYILHPDHWRKGLTFEALSTILPRAFAKWPDMPALTAEADPRNIGSTALLEKLGFKQTGYAEKNFLYGADEWCDTVYFELPRDLETEAG